MKIKKQLFYNILIFIIYYAFFSLSTIRFSNYDEIQYPTAIATFVLLTSIYIMLFINKRSLFFYTISAIVILLIGIISTEFSLEFFWGYFEDRLNFYIFQHLIFFVSCCFLLILINKILKKYSFVREDEFIFIKGKNCIAVLLLFIIFIASIFRSIDQYTDLFRYYYSQNQSEPTVLDTVAVVVPVDVYNSDDNYETESNFEHEEEETISTYSLSSLWENPEDDEKIIQDLIVFYIDAFLPLDGQGSLEHINQYNNVYEYFGITTEEENETVLKYYDNCAECKINFTHAVKLKNKINRDPNLIKSVFYTYKHLLYNSLSRKNYYKTDINNYVDILILSYSDIQSQEDPEKILNKIYEKAVSGDSGLTNAIKQMISDDYMNEYKNIYFGNGTKVRDNDFFWAYTFWSRRHKENNTKEIYDILVEVQNHYGEN